MAKSAIYKIIGEEIKMAKHESLKIVSVPLASISFNLSENVRDPVRDYADITSLMNDIRERGQLDAVTLRKLPNGELHPLRGFRRIFALTKLNELYPNGYETESGEKQRFDTVKAHTVDSIDDNEAFVMLLDHGNIQQLSQVGLHIAIMRSFEHRKNEKWIVNSLRGLIDTRHSIPAGKLKEMRDKVEGKLVDIKPDSPRYLVERQRAEEEVYFQFRRGLIQVVHRVYDSPNVVQDAYLKKMRGEQIWPSDKEVSELLAVYQAEYAADSMNIDKANPGPKFLEAWNKLAAAKIEADASGTRPKAASMMSRADVDDTEKNVNSKLLKACLKVIKRECDRSVMITLDKLCVSCESTLNDEQKKLMEQLLLAVKVPAAA